jgi:uncharacterized membrane protein
VVVRQQELSIQAMMQFSGPLPPPEVLERYNHALPGAAERSFAMAESQHAHRQELEKQIVAANVSAQKLGAWFGFIVAMTVIAGGFWSLLEGKSVAGVAAIITALVGLVGVFAYSKYEQHAELASKRDALVVSVDPRQQQ